MKTPFPLTQTLYPLSSIQRDIWFDQARHPDSPMCNLGYYHRIGGGIDPQIFREALTLLVQENDALRLRLTEQDGMPLQSFPEMPQVDLGVCDCSQEGDPLQEAISGMQQAIRRPFRVFEEPLFRYTLYKLSEDCLLWSQTYHALAVDSGAVGLIAQRVAALYCALQSGGPIPIRQGASYREFVENDAAYLESAGFDLHRDYWQHLFSTLPEPLLPPRAGYANRTDVVPSVLHTWFLPRKQYAQLDALARAHSASACHVLLGLLYVYFTRIQDQDECVIGLSVPNRDTPAFGKTIGLFAKTIPARFSYGREIGFVGLIQAIAGALRESNPNQRFPASEINRLAGVSPAGHRRLFDLSLSVERPVCAASFGSRSPSEIRMLDNGFEQTPLAVSVRDYSPAPDIQVDFSYNLAYFGAPEIGRLQRRFVCLLEEVLRQPRKRISELNILPPEERRHLLVDWNATATPLPETCVHQRFEGHVVCSPDATAVVFEDEILTYTELNARANQLAHTLIGYGVTFGAPVAIALERSPEMIVALLAALKAGGAYVPLDPDYPAERLTFMLEDSGAGILITRASLRGRLPHTAAHTLCVDDDRAAIAIQSQSNPDLPVAPGHLAYIIYTSGSTGKPKGVAIAHLGLANLAQAQILAFGVTPDSRVLQFASFSFDASVSEVFMALGAGAALHIPNTEQRLPGLPLRQYLADAAITHLTMPPTVLASLPTTDLPGLTSLIVAGESCPPALAAFWSKGRRFFNAYGPTEVTVCATIAECAHPDIDTAAALPIGRPIANTRLYVLDNHGHPTPIGVPGELHIGGVGLARGYLNRPELTAEKFIADPFSQAPGDRLYKTGDLVRYRPDGNLEFLGRLDHQVKIRGFRIELGEIEAALAAHPAVREAAVLAITEETGDRRLVAYLVEAEPSKQAASPLPPTASDLRTFLKTTLPDYMLPAAFVSLAALPVTPNGKIDRQFLARSTPEMSILPCSRSPLFEPRAIADDPFSDTPALTGDSTLEARIYALWQELLPGVQLGVHDGFFDAGGNSLLLMRLYEKLETCWPGIFTVGQLFADNTIAGQARCIREATAGHTRATVRPPCRNADTAPARTHVADPRIAIVGMALRLPGAETLETCWQDVAAGVDRIHPLSEERTADARTLLALSGGAVPEHFREAAWLDDIFTFDHERFRLSPADAVLLDPEQRLFLETALMAIEDSGYGGKAMDDEKVGVFVGANSGILWRDLAWRIAPDRAEQVYVLNVPSNIATRLSFLHNWRGPATLVDTACSSTLTAVHLACQSLIRGECTAALVGGAKLILLPFAAEWRFTIDSSTGRTHAFDESADGMGAGEGAIVFLLKTLEQARADGDAIHALILGTAINQDGASSGMAAPNPAAQAEMIRTAARQAQVPLATLSYIEAHGTGTSLGDPIEIEGIRRAFASETTETGFAAIGSGKGNYGHLDGCAGALGLLRAVLCLKHDQAPPQPFFQRANPRIEFALAPVRVCRQLTALADRGTPRRAGVSSFGMSGINVHAVIEAPPGKEPPRKELFPGWTVVGVSAATQELLVSYVADLVRVLRAQPDDSLADTAYTLNTGRESLAERLAVWVQDRGQLLTAWEAFLAGQGTEKRLTGTVTRQQKKQEAEPAPSLAADEGAAMAAAQAFAEGAPLVWPSPPLARRIHLPPSPLQRITNRPDLRTATALNAVKPLHLGPPGDTSEGISRSLDVHAPAFWPVGEYRLDGVPTFVGMGLLPILAEARAGLSGDTFSPFSVRDLSWLQPLQTPSLKAGSVSLLITPPGAAGERRAILGGRGLDGLWQRFAEATLASAPLPPPNPLDLKQCEQEAGELSPAPSFRVDRGGGLVVSARWDCLRQVGGTGDRVLALLELPPEGARRQHWQGLHPALLDCASRIAVDRPGLTAAGCAEILVYSPLPSKVLAYALRRTLPDGGIEADLSLCHPETGAVCLAFRKLRFAVPSHRKSVAKVPVLPSLPVWLPAPLTPTTPFPPALVVIGEGELCERITAHGEVTLRLVAATGSFDPALEALAAVAAGRVSHLLLVPAPGEDMGTRGANVLRLILLAMHQPLHLLVVGQGAFAKDPQSGIQPAPDAAFLAGLVPIAAQEEAMLSTRYLDVDAQTPVESILQEFTAFDHPPGTPILLDRSGARLRRDFVPVPPAAGPAASIWPDSGCCVVTGGTGGLALLLAEELAAGGAVTLALISRHALPSGDDDDARLRRERLEALTRRGLRFRHWCADVSDRGQLARVLDDIRRELGPITAVVHTAGLPDSRLLIKEDTASFIRASAPKVAGARNLDLLTRNDPLQAFVLSGSLSAIEERPGTGVYAAANAFLDAFAVWRRNEGRSALTIDWCQIGELGMAARMLKGRYGEYDLTPEDIVRLWRLALASGAPQVTLLYDKKAEQKTAAIPPEPKQPQTLEEALAEIWAKVLGYDRVMPDDDFYALGGDSLFGIQIIEAIVSQLGHRVTFPDLIEAGTVKALAARLRTRASAADTDLPAGAAAIKSPVIDQAAIEATLVGAGGDSPAVMNDRENLSSAAVPIPSNRILPGASRITPDLLPLITLTQTEIDQVLCAVDGGAGNIQDIYPLAPLQEGILFHHLLQSTGDAYLNYALLAFDSLARRQAFIAALQAVVDRHDILRTAVIWKHLPEPVQVVWRRSVLPVESVHFEPGAGPIAEQLVAAFHSGQTRLDLTRAPLLRLVLAEDGDRALMLFLSHHLIIDNVTWEIMLEEIAAHLQGHAQQLTPSVPFRNFVAQSCRGISPAAHEAFFRDMLGDIDRPTAPFGLLDMQGDGSKIVEAQRELPRDLALRLRTQARRHGASPAALCHLAWALVLSRCCDQAGIVFGTVLFGRMQGGGGIERALGLFINTLPIRITCDARPVAGALRETQKRLLALLRHEHASLSLAQRCSAIPAPAPLFSALLNYRHSPVQGDTAPCMEGVELLQSESRTNYPFVLSVDDRGEGFGLTAQVSAASDPDRICALMQRALESLVTALEETPEAPLSELDFLTPAEKQKLRIDFDARALPQSTIGSSPLRSAVGTAPPRDSGSL